jgi:hypothetical protein
MDKVLKIIGGIWALMGAGNMILGMNREPSPEGVPTFGLMFSVGLFVIPGIIVYAIGAGISRKRTAKSPSGKESH